MQKKKELCNPKREVIKIRTYLPSLDEFLSLHSIKTTQTLNFSLCLCKLKIQLKRGWAQHKYSRNRNFVLRIVPGKTSPCWVLPAGQAAIGLKSKLTPKTSTWAKPKGGETTVSHPYNPPGDCGRRAVPVGSPPCSIRSHQKQGGRPYSNRNYGERKK